MKARLKATACMVPALELPCEVRARIREQVYDRLRAYAAALRELESHSATALLALDSDDLDGFKRTKIAAESAKAAYDTASEELVKHIEEHGCPL